MLPLLRLRDLGAVLWNFSEDFWIGCQGVSPGFSRTEGLRRNTVQHVVNEQMILFISGGVKPTGGRIATVYFSEKSPRKHSVET